jgi:hypothetical protein
MLHNKLSFTIIEFIFVVLIIAVLSSFTFMKINSSNNADFILCKNDYYLINKAINQKLQNNLFTNQNQELEVLQYDNKLFSNILDNFYSNNWKLISLNKYTYKINNNQEILFTYDNTSHKFSCDTNNELCKKVLN